MSEHLLVVEDEEPLRRNLVRFLEREGHTVTGYGSAEEALAAVSVRNRAMSPSSPSPFLTRYTRAKIRLTAAIATRVSSAAAMQASQPWALA